MDTLPLDLNYFCNFFRRSKWCHSWLIFILKFDKYLHNKTSFQNFKVTHSFHEGYNPFLYLSPLLSYQAPPFSETYPASLLWNINLLLHQKSPCYPLHPPLQTMFFNSFFFFIFNLKVKEKLLSLAWLTCITSANFSL